MLSKLLFRGYRESFRDYRESGALRAHFYMAFGSHLWRKYFCSFVQFSLTGQPAFHREPFSHLIFDLYLKRLLLTTLWPGGR